MPLVQALLRELRVKDAIASPAARAKCAAAQALLEAKALRAAALRPALAALLAAIVRPMAAVLRLRVDLALVLVPARIVAVHRLGPTAPLLLPTTPIAARPDKVPVVPAPP